VRLPVICASADVIASLLVICVILQTGCRSQVSESETATLTGTSLVLQLYLVYPALARRL